MITTLFDMMISQIEHQLPEVTVFHLVSYLSVQKHGVSVNSNLLLKAEFAAKLVYNQTLVHGGKQDFVPEQPVLAGRWDLVKLWILLFSVILYDYWLCNLHALTCYVIVTQKYVT